MTVIKRWNDSYFLAYRKAFDIFANLNQSSGEFVSQSYRELDASIRMFVACFGWKDWATEVFVNI